MKFLIWAPPYYLTNRLKLDGTPSKNMSGGCIALHKLAHNLEFLGEEAYIDAPNKNPNWLGKLWKQEEDFDVVIYPEIITDNFYGENWAVRWILNNGISDYGENDLFFKFANYFYCFRTCHGELRAFDMRLENFKDLNYARTGEVYLIRKGNLKIHDKHSPLAIQLHEHEEDEELEKIFNISKRFISYDHACFTSVQAALCGCLSIVIPDGITPKEIWREKFPYFKFGIAYGLDDINWAINTLDLVRQNLVFLGQESIDLTRKFIDICRDKALREKHLAS